MITPVDLDECQKIIDGGSKLLLIYALFELSISKPRLTLYCQAIAAKLGYADDYLDMQKRHAASVAEKLSEDPMPHLTDPGYPTQSFGE